MSVLLVSLHLTLTLVSCSQSATYYVTPTANTVNCPKMSPCFNLSYYTSDPTKYFVSGTEFIFLTGEHSLQTTGFVVIRDITSLSLVGSQAVQAKFNSFGRYLSSLDPPAKISCSSNLSGFAFMNISDLKIKDIGFEHCGAVIDTDLAIEALSIQTNSFYTIPNDTLKSALFLVNVYTLYLSGVEIKQSYGYGLLAVNVIGKVLIQRCSFLANNIYTNLIQHCRYPSDDLDMYSCIGGNVQFLYVDPIECPTTFNIHMVLIQQSRILGGVDFNTMSILTNVIKGGSGLGVSFSQTTFGVNLILSDSLIFGNTASEGANLHFDSYAQVEQCSVKIQDCLVMNGNVPIPLNNVADPETDLGQIGVGMSFYHGIVNYVQGFTSLNCKISDSYQNVSMIEILTIQGTTFAGNVGMFSGSGVGMLLHIYPHSNENHKRSITLDNVTFSDNVGFIGAGLKIYIERTASPMVNVTITRTVFSYNKPSVPLEALAKLDFSVTLEANTNYLISAMFIYGVVNMNIDNCVFKDNEIPAILAINSRLTFSGSIEFTNNTGINGGALILEGNSVVYFTPHLHISFIYNFAYRRGGAIYVNTFVDLYLFCFFEIIDSLLVLPSEMDIVLLFEGNAANESGDILYGGYLDQCATYGESGFVYYYNILDGGIIFDALTELKQSPTNSLISSDPEGICFCVEGVPNCSINRLSLSLFQGQSFQVPLVAVGQRDSVVPTEIRAFIVGPTTAYFEPLQDLQDSGNDCMNLTYTLSSNNATEEIMFIPQRFNFLTNIRRIDVQFLPCPIGFELSVTLGKCVCSIQLQQRHASCNIDSETILRMAPYWFSTASGEFAYHDHCPFDYCHDVSVEMKLNEPDHQCASNRSGILCGKCENGLSLTLGTSKCKKCSNVYLLLLIPFAIMGIVLATLLPILNMTVRYGTIHGVVFYANVVKINQAAFFSSNEVNVFTVFLSWINLDFGIETCFYDGLDTYSSVWLQFLFPLYIWTIGIAIIVCAHYSTTVSEIFSNAVHVLPTLFLLSFTKILRAVIMALSFTVLRYDEGTDQNVWLYDGNLHYGNGKHIALIVVAIFFLCMALPYTFILLFVDLLRRYSHVRAFKWVTKVKPYMDAYTGPYKDNRSFWTGFLLLIRVVFVLTFAFNILGDPALNLMIVNIASIVLVAILMGGIYKSWMLNVLEMTFLINLGVLSAASCYISVAGGNQNALGATSVTIVFVELLGIILYHVFVHSVISRYIISLPRWRGYRQPIAQLQEPLHHDAEPQLPDRAEEQLAVPLENLIRPGSEGIFDEVNTDDFEVELGDLDSDDNTEGRNNIPVMYIDVAELKDSQ